MGILKMREAQIANSRTCFIATPPSQWPAKAAGNQIEQLYNKHWVAT